MDEYVKINYFDMPITVKAFTFKDGHYYIISINSRLSAEQNMRSLKHELMHIRNGDFDKPNLNYVELYSHVGGF